MSHCFRFVLRRFLRPGMLLAILGIVAIGTASPLFAQSDAVPDSSARIGAALTDSTWRLGSRVVVPEGARPRVTLTQWGAERRLLLLDRHHALGGVTYDRGVFRHLMPGMDREYDIDKVTYGYTLQQDYRWMQMENGLRTQFGSIERTEWSIVTDFKQTVDLADRHTFRVDGRIQEDRSAQRSVVEMTYGWTVAPKHTAGVRHTFSSDKADLDVSFYYTYGDVQNGRIQAEVTLMDMYHDFMYQTLGVDPRTKEFTRRYESNPYLGQFTLQTPAKYDLRGEVVVGVQTESDLFTRSLFSDRMRFRDREAAHYASALVEYDAGPVSGGLVYQRDASRLTRRGLSDSLSSRYTSEQRFHRGGAFLTGRWGPFHGEAWAFIGHYFDRQDGSDFTGSLVTRDPNWKSQRRNYRLRLYYRPPSTGWFFGTEYLALQRDLGGKSRTTLANQWTRRWFYVAPSQYRLNAQVGYRFQRGAFLIGINYDLDGDAISFREGDGQVLRDLDPKRFDNGFFRFVLGW